MSAPALGLADIPALLDLVAQHKYNVGHVKIALPRHAVVAFHAGTSLPSQISGLGELAAGTLVYKQEWGATTLAGPGQRRESAQVVDASCRAGRQGCVGSARPGVRGGARLHARSGDCACVVPLDDELYGADARASEERVRALLPKPPD